MATKANKKLERRMKEFVMQSEDERRHADQYKEQVRQHITLLPCVLNVGF